MKKILAVIIIGLLCLSMFSILAPLVKATSLPPVGYWKFDEGSGNIAHDSSGNIIDGTIYDAAWTTGKLGGALSFDGINDYVEIPQSSVLDFSGSISIEAWVKVDGATGDYQIIVAKWYPGGNLAGSYVLEFQPDGVTPQFVLRTTGRIDTVSSVLVPFGSWAHIAGTYDGAVAKIYVNGALTGSQPVTGEITVGNQLYIGSHSPVQPADRNWFNGVIDEVAIYDYARTAEEIWNDYASATRVVGLLVLPTSQEELSLRQRIENLGFATELIYETDLPSTDLTRYAAVIEAEPRLTRNGLSVMDLVENQGVNILFLEDGIDDIRYDYGGTYREMPSGLYTIEILDDSHPITSDYALGEDVRISYGSEIHDWGVVGLTNLPANFPLTRLGEPSGYSDTIALGVYAPKGRMALYGVVFDEERHLTPEGLNIFDKALQWITGGTQRYALVFVPLNWQGDISQFPLEAQIQSQIIIDSVDALTPSNTEVIILGQNLILDFDKSERGSEIFNQWSAISSFAINQGVTGDRFIALTNENIWGSVVGLTTFYNRVVVVDVSTRYEEVSSHELGHTWGLLDEYTLVAWQQEADLLTSQGLPIPNEYPGYDRGTLFVEDGTTYRCMMGFAGMPEPRAFEPDERGWIDDRISSEQTAVASAFAEFIITFYRNGTSPHVESFRGVPSPGRFMQFDLPSNYSIQTYSGAGALAYSSNISYSFLLLPSQLAAAGANPQFIDEIALTWIVPIFKADETIIQLKDNIENTIIASLEINLVWSSDSLGNPKDIFVPGETVYVTVPRTGQMVTLYVVADQTAWNDGEALTDVSGGAETPTLNPPPGTQTIEIWGPPLVVGNYDIVMDVNNDGVFDSGLDLVDSVLITGFNVIPEVPFGTAMSFASMFIALVWFLKTKRFRPKKRPQQKR